ncbi:hypothetical protein L198_07027 [Cryptococcus wingfieldii CBS 7118]|uniref:DUF6570 domain-containing protein n=1 Tax=Cryptococcus wingfieldii CBS 7118 TaxID=1295528 RepID=A0A1E3IFM7_9TREE|nr:hypothetical protein L198_07027 [Cryptococcus wingfieldii CBS 7118]ODN87403.1 hypothetical protein L198_07027 [Cryptococcus wingfieldii CBS 7118]
MFLGDIPAVLAGLTWVETVCIARARASRCCVKIKGHGSHQSKGNVVILPQAASELLRLLPLPASVIANEIVVIWVASQAEPLTVDKIPKKLLTVRRDKIIAALQWLKENNPLYSDVSIDGNALTSYPEDGHLPMPCFNSLASASTEAEGAGYVPPATTPSQSSDASQPSEDVMVDVSGCVDSNSSGHHVDLRKVSALAAIKGGAQFLAYPSGSTPMQEYSAPTTFAALYPRLFPYGCGSFEDLPFIYSLFFFILIANLNGNIPYADTRK